MTTQLKNTIVSPLTSMLQTNGHYGPYGGSAVPEVLAQKLNDLDRSFTLIAQHPQFQAKYIQLLKDFVGRPTPLYFAPRLSEKLGARIYLKREDLNHTGSHKINNTIGQILVAKELGATEIIAETGAGQHGVATATAAAMFGLKCKVFMGKTDMERQALNVRRMELLGAEVIPALGGRQTLKDAVDAALEYYINHPDSYYLLGSHVGPHPYPKMVGYFQSVIGVETRQQILLTEGRLPDSIFACVGGGSNAIGLFSAFLNDEQVKLYGGEGGGENQLGATAATLTFGKPAVFQGCYSYCLVDENKKPLESQSIAAGLDYPGISPQHAYLKDSHRASYIPVADAQAKEAFQLLAHYEGILPAIESAHALAAAIPVIRDSQQLVIVSISGRGDKDVERDF